MRTFAQKPKTTQQTASAKSTIPSRAHFGQSPEVSSILQLQRTIGNQAVLRMSKTHAEDPDVGLTAAVSPRVGHDFSQIPIHPPAAGGIQTKLAINQPGDEYEQEADRVSEQVMRMPDPQPQRACPCGGGCPKCQTEHRSQEHVRLQTKGVGSGALGQTAVPPIVHVVLRSPGRPLDPATRGFMESRFGHDFSRVRVHTGENAAASAKAVGALAYAYGSDVTFGAGQYSPHTSEGRCLLAHELAHVVQQQPFIPQNDALADGNTATEVEAERAAAAALGDDVAVIRERRAGVIQLKRDGDVKPTQPTLIKNRAGNTERIEDAYGAGSLDETQWRNLFDSAEQALAKGQNEAAKSAYLTLYADVAKLAQATRVVTSSGVINMVTGTKHTCKDARPGLNFSLQSASGWGGDATGTTGYVDDQGKFGVDPSTLGVPRPLVAIVLNRDAFTREKEKTLGVLRHEMVHAEHYSERAVEVSDPKAKSGRVETTRANTELLAYVEGFMTMFHLTHPPPTSDKDPAFFELLGALSTTEVFPWAEADPLVRSETLGRLQEYYCNALDPPHHEAFDAWVGAKLGEARRDKIIIGGSSPGSLPPGQEDFFSGIQRVIASKCKGLRTPMKL
jgi:hypothetical protein